MGAQSFSHIRLICNPMDCVTHQAPLSMGFSRQGYWSGLPFPPPGDLPNPGIKLGSPAWQEDSLTAELQEKPQLAKDYQNKAQLQGKGQIKDMAVIVFADIA